MAGSAIDPRLNSHRPTVEVNTELPYKPKLPQSLHRAHSHHQLIQVSGEVDWLQDLLLSPTSQRVRRTITITWTSEEDERAETKSNCTKRKATQYLHLQPQTHLDLPLLLVISNHIAVELLPDHGQIDVQKDQSVQVKV